MSQLAHKFGVIAGIVAGVFSLFLFSSTSQAVTASDWNAGNIMSDNVFFNSSEMSTAEIQNFLNAKMPTCNTWHARSGSANDSGPPYTCLKDYLENPTTHQNNGNAGGGGSVPGGWNAAQIIKHAADSYDINPKVLIVLLQKEQSLITDDWPWAIQYRSATGYGCPDTAPCDAEYYGFYNQVMKSAYQFTRYAANPGSYRYKANQVNYIQYNPNAGCGGTNVFIANQTTAGLYNYTPYQPNPSALANLYGSGDSCGAYGNRNFWRLYSDWFGSTQGAPYSWEWAGQYAYTNSSKTTQRDLGAMRLGEQAYVSVRARNTGTTTWTNSGPNPVRIGTTSPANRDSVFSPFSGWLGPSRPAQLQEASVAPGEVGTFDFWITANATGLYNERFNLLAEGRAWFNDPGLNFGIGVIPDTYSWAWNSQYAYTDETKTTPRSLSNLRAGERIYAGFTARNTGNVTWSNTGPHPVRVGTSNPNERTSTFSDFSGWLNSRRPAVMRETSVAPGGIGTFEFWMTANNLGTFNERFNLVAENKTWLNDLGLSYGIGVRADNYSWAWNSQYAFTDSTKTTPKDLQTLQIGERAFVGVTAKNTGNVAWTNSGPNPVRIGTAGPNERSSTFSDFSGWIINNRRPVALKESTVAPGAIGTFEFWMTGNALGSYNERFNILAEDRVWLNDLGLSYGIKVNP